LLLGQDCACEYFKIIACELQARLTAETTWCATSPAQEAAFASGPFDEHEIFAGNKQQKLHKQKVFNHR